MSNEQTGSIKQDDFDNLAKNWGVEVPEVTQSEVVNTGTAFYEHNSSQHTRI